LTQLFHPDAERGLNDPLQASERTTCPVPSLRCTCFCKVWWKALSSRRAGGGCAQQTAMSLSGGQQGLAPGAVESGQMRGLAAKGLGQRGSKH